MRNTLLMALLAAGCAPATTVAAESLCERSDSRTTPSPDGKWVASVQEQVCATATGVAAGVTVELVAARDPAHSKRVFIMPVPRSRDDWPRVRWQAPDTLEVRVPNLAEASPPHPDFDGIRISLAYCGDNLQDRMRLMDYRTAVLQWQKDVTAWAALRKQDPASAGARPPRPEDPRLAHGQCID